MEQETGWGEQTEEPYHALVGKPQSGGGDAVVLPIERVLCEACRCRCREVRPPSLRKKAMGKDCGGYQAPVATDPAH